MSEQARARIVKLIKEVHDPECTEYDLIQRIAYNMRFYDIGEEEAMNMIEDYFLDAKMVKEQAKAQLERRN